MTEKPTFSEFAIGLAGIVVPAYIGIKTIEVFDKSLEGGGDMAYRRKRKGTRKKRRKSRKKRRRR